MYVALKLDQMAKPYRCSWLMVYASSVLPLGLGDEPIGENRKESERCAGRAQAVRIDGFYLNVTFPVSIGTLRWEYKGGGLIG